MGRNSTKIDLEEGQDDDEIATTLFLADDEQSSKKAQKKKLKVEQEESKERDLQVTENKSKKRKEADKSSAKASSTPPPKKKIKEQDDGKDDKDGKKYQRLILFVGQIPFEATSEDLAKHFEDHGAGKVNVRLLTEKGTNKSRGLAFVDFETPQQLVRGLRVHRTRLLGRAINVERTVGGGGNNEGRKEKLKQLREFQGSKVKKEVDDLVNDAIQRSNGLLTKLDADELVVRSLCTLPREAAKQVLDEILESDIAHARNKKAWILGCIKRYVSRLKTGEQFLTLEEEKAGIIEKRKEKPREPRGAANAHKRTHIPTPDRPREGERKGRTFSSNTTPNKFKRGRIGASSDE